MKELQDLIDEFYKENEEIVENEFYKTVYEKYYTTVAASFKDEVEEYCKVVIFGDEYAMSVQELYDYDRDLAIETWRHYVDRSLEEDFRDWANEVIWDELDEFTEEFQKWLSRRNDERAADAIVALMSGDIDLEDAVYEWLRARLGYEYWDYPA